MIKFSVKKPMTVFVVVFVIIILSVVSFLKMTPDLIPSIDLPYMVVVTTYPGATPSEVESSVTKPLEQGLASIEGLKNIMSISNSNYSLVILEFENDESMDSATVNTLQAVDLVEGSFEDGIGSPYIMKINPTMIPITVASIDMEGKSVSELSTFVSETLMNKLEGIDGVASISTGGLIESTINIKISEEKIEDINNKLANKINKEAAQGRSQLISGISQIEDGITEINNQINQLEYAHNNSLIDDNTYNESLTQLNTQKENLEIQKETLESTLESVNKKINSALKEADLSQMITVEMVSNILQAQNFSMPAGYVQDGDTEYLVSVGDKISDLEDAKNLYITSISGIGDIRLDDICDILMETNEDEVFASINGNPGVLLTFSKQSNYATAKVSKNIQSEFSTLEEEYEGLNFTVLMDQGDYIYLIIDAILESLLYGALFAIIILLLFLRDLRPTLITLLSIPISLAFAIMLMYFTGVTINMLSLSGLAVAVGMLVDNSIVVIENIYRLRRMGVDPKKAAVKGAKDVCGAIIASTLTTICVFFPIVFIEGITRKLFSDMALTITYSLVCSLIIALTLVPSLSSMMLKGNIKEEREKETKFKDLYKKFLNWNLGHKAIILGIALILFVGSVFLSLSKGFIYIPDMSTPQMTGTITMNDPEAEVSETKEVSIEVLERLSKVEGVETVGGMLGSTSMGSLMGETLSQEVSLYIIVDSDTKLSGKEIAENCVNACSDLPCTVEILSTSSITSYTSALGGTGVGINVYSDDQDKLQEACKEVALKLQEVEGIDEVDNGLTDSELELHFTVNKDKAMKLGLTVAQVYLEVYNAMSKSEESTQITIDGDEYSIIVSEAGDLTVNRSEIENLSISYTTQSGKTGTVKLKDICDITEKESLPSINRTNQRTYLSVTGTVKEGYNVTNVTRDAKEALEDLELESGVSIEFSGENETIMDAIYDLLKMLGIGIVLVYLIMVAQFQSLKSPFIIMFTIPLAFTGGLLALLIFNKEISIIAMIGFIILVGVIVNNGIVLVDCINQYRGEGLAKKDAIIKASTTRIRPVMMTSLTTILGLVVLAIGKTAGTDMMQPVALVSIGGLLYATLLTLIVVPVIYDIFNGEKFNVIKEADLDITGIENI